MVNKSISSDGTAHSYKRICWTAILVGALVAIGLGFLLNLFGLAIGLSAITVHENGTVGLAIGGMIGIFIAVVICMLVAGYVAGYLGRMHCPKRNLGILYGFTTWSVALLLSAVVAAHISQYAIAYSHSIGGANALIAEHVKTAIPGIGDAAIVESTDLDKTAVASPSYLSGAAFVLFALFFSGALASCLGACWAMTCRRED